MVRKFIYLLCFILFKIVCGQDKIFVYDYQYKIDSLNRNRIDQETMFLDISETRSVYFSLQKYTDDSLNSDELKKSNAKIPVISMKSKIQDVIIKDYITKNTEIYTTLNGDYYKIQPNRKIDWKIQSDTKNIFGYKSQKATANFGGREWVAWFASEIPIQDGPYVFSGLPGLIVEVADSKNDHQLKLISIRKRSIVPSNDFNEGSINVTTEKFNQLWNKYKKDPIIKIRQVILNSDGKFTMYNAQGEEMDRNEILKFKEKVELDKIKHNNNFIDLILYKASK
ncbi:GLPGLI family protein [Chryseobacterium sp. c4a]|uniref:GLPGLI family protein n=1 Tax=Chryseobacterium sp. c4a TaxID=1573582 RepID=UPI00135BAD64|nr:GLPGLI family protein [Chryseobacterium sp. c4a]